MAKKTHDIPAWIAFNKDLAAVGRKIIAELTTPEEKQYPQSTLLAGFVRKATNTLQAIVMLVEHEYWEEAQALTRVLFELRATFDCFWQLFEKDHVAATKQAYDCMMLDKFKQIRTVNEQGFVDPQERTDWEQIIKEIESRYGTETFKLLKQHGFTCKSVEDRCRQAKLSHVYDIIYRSFSRNIHSTDLIEQVGNLVLESPDFADYLESKNTTMLYAANFSAGGLLICCDLDDHYTTEFDEFKERQKTLTTHIDQKEGF